MYESPRFNLDDKLYALAVLSKSWALLGVSSNAKPSMGWFTHSGLDAYRLLAFGDVRHVAGVGAKNRTNPSLKRFWVG
ncbi:hypothetical protein [Neisseria subflava]|jgi:low affinity ammonium uptake protein|nr:hypothetical protein [Neisseria subflava]